ncbi:MAG: S8 family serine peptidase [Isosphaeraceae bacterium]|nr:S8 family serine peptidase [Isosphaeraceae bacterium]
MGVRAARCLLVLLACGRFAWAQGDGPVARQIAAGDRPAASRLANAEDVRRRLGLVPGYESVARVSAIKVAVLDYGFDGNGGAQPYLPEGVVVVEHYDPEFVRQYGLGDPNYRKGFEPSNRHGRVMAQIIWAVTGSHRDGPKFYLLNANGPTMLRRAVRYAIEQKVDVVLFSGSFEGGGNGDGRGPINRIVDEALAANIVWINAAGNYGRRVYNGPVRILPDGYLRLRDGLDVAALRFRNRVDENDVSITLTWNDYKDAEDAGTAKDLDLFVEDSAGRRVGTSEKTQVTTDGPAGPNESRNPRERVVLKNLAACPDVPSDPDYGYRIRVRATRGAFTSADRLRVLVTASRDAYMAPAGTVREAFEFVDATGEGEVYPPADNPLVLTVGDSDPSTSIGPTLDRRVKPDVILDDSRAFFTDGVVSAGSSNAAAYVAGVVTVLKATAPALGPGELLRIARQGSPVRSQRVRGPASGLAPQYFTWQTPTRSRLAEVVLGVR